MRYSFSTEANKLIEGFAATRPMHANSLIVSIYGDTICPRGNTIWLGNLIQLVAPLGINERLVRTSVFRLAEKNILTSKQIGRRSYYSLTDNAYRQFLSASKRIYATHPPTWDGEWRLVITSLGNLPSEALEALHKELQWLGFSKIATGVYAHPSAAIEEVEKLIEETGLDERIALLKAVAANANQMPVTNRLIRDSYDLQTSDSDYQQLILEFENIHASTEHAKKLDPKLCFLTRTLLIHRYRHILLKEPELPTGIAPESSTSKQAKQLVGALYRVISPGADDYYSSIFGTEAVPVPKPQDSYSRRFTEDY